MSYVIGVKEVRDYYGNPIPENKQKYLYAQNVNGKRVLNKSVANYSFSDCYNAVKFATKEGAKSWWRNNRNKIENIYRFDWSTLTIFSVLYLKAEKLSWNIE